MYTLGIDIGYSSVKAAVLDDSGTTVHTEYLLHKGDVARELLGIVERILLLPQAGDIAVGAVVGSGGPLLTDGGRIHHVNEVAALIEGVLLLDGDCSSIIEIGGQTAKFVTGYSRRDRKALQVSMTSNCSSGTGSFLEEQVSRLGLNIEGYSAMAAKHTFIPRIAGRCSVFAKTDIIHHQQEGVSTSDILAGLAHAVVKNYRSAVMRGQPRTPPLFFAGGVAKNSAIADALVSEIGLDKDSLHRDERSALAGAMGAARLAARQKMPLDLPALVAFLQTDRPCRPDRHEAVRLAPLGAFGEGDGERKHDCPARDQRENQCWLGIDVGSTSTNVVLADSANRILDFRYIRTAGNPVQAVRTGLAQLQAAADSLLVAGVGVTGSGRYMIGRLVGADVVRDEITAQARAASAIDPEVDTVFEIGGQDSKYIAMENGVVTDFQMNKICAAGTGSFIEEQARKLGLSLGSIGQAALAASSPTNLGERCTVFIESSIAAHLSHGADLGDLVAGLCYSIVKNYMNRVVSRKRVGSKIFLQGGIAFNQGVVNAFRAVTGKPVVVPPFFSVTGALGAAILAREAMEAENRSQTEFKGFNPADLPAPQTAQPVATQSDFAREVQDFIFQGYEPRRDPNRKTVGIPRALFTFGMFPLFHPFFRELGCNVLLSDPTSEETIRLAQEYSLDETCYPVKLINGHAAQLVEKGVDFLFFPDLHTVSHPGSRSRQDYGCPYMQAAFKIINKAMGLESRGIKLLAPTISFNQGREFIQKAFMDMAWEVGANKEQAARALQTAMQSHKAFEARVEARGKQMGEVIPGEKTFVLVSKIYGVADPVLNLGIPDKLAEMGYRTLPFYALPEADIFGKHPNMYWPFAQHILAAAVFSASRPDLYPILLTHHGCGPDTVTAHYFREIMGGKPFLTIEVDEHSSGVGVLTRVEAFVNSLSGRRSPWAAPPCRPTEATEKGGKLHTGLPTPQGGPLLLPSLFPYSQLIAEGMRAHGYDVELFAQSSAASIDMGREHTLTNEYFSLAALTGDLFQTLARRAATPMTVVLPQNEGAEVDGQYARFIRTKLDENAMDQVTLCAPFLEDLLGLEDESAQDMFLCLLAGDLVLLAPPQHREYLLETLHENQRGHRLDIQLLLSVARHVRAWNEKPADGKRIFALGEPMVLFNDMLNDGTFTRLEQAGHRVARAPLSEYMWSFWRDHVVLSGKAETAHRGRRLFEFQRLIRLVGEELGPQGHFESDLEAPMLRADDRLGYYDGAFGRYRSAKIEGAPQALDGIIAVSSMYENTGISLEILRKQPCEGKPFLSLTFDGNPNENDRIKTDSFIHYL
ncbi:CoA activase [Pseudodesulfovibrio sp. F-1]|uniref:CoA activase n=1 Tax=Pseudodesulfovibrio alkaliphilus TaxID=2661613 RepID=A0A7K1KRK9_9BACT|nr:acyl-CoA dehydratase activase [Pseudodesulfovibrio alkaliphilus]MUM78501.1 CoA activase [Pseudodesulfovibrio alkaliphilus]